LAVTTAPPAHVTNRQNFATQPVVQVQDVNGVALGAAGLTVTASVPQGNATLAGTTSVQTDANGVATFTDLQLQGAAGAYVITYSSPNLTPATSNVTIDAGTPTFLTLNAGDQ